MAKCIILMEPGGFEKFFVDFSVPEQTLSLPPMPEGPPSPELMQMFVAGLAKYKVDMPIQQE